MIGWLTNVFPPNDLGEAKSASSDPLRGRHATAARFPQQKNPAVLTAMRAFLLRIAIHPWGEEAAEAQAVGPGTRSARAAGARETACGQASYGHEAVPSCRSPMRSPMMPNDR